MNSQAHHQVLGVFAESVGAGLATLVKVMAELPAKVVLFARKDIGCRLVDHESIFPFLEKFDGITLRSHSESSSYEFDVLFVTWGHSLHFTQEDRAVLKRALARSKRRVLLYDGQFGTYWDMLKQQAKALGAELSLLSQMDEICYMTVYPKVDLLSFFKQRYPLSVGINIDLLYDDSKLAGFYSEWDTKEQRRFAISCSGNKTSSRWRAELVAHLEHNLKTIPLTRLIENEALNTYAEGKKILWSVNGRRISTAAYVEVLSQSDFVLCIPGTSWTHRPFESLVRGAIPIVDEYNLRVHDLPWEDGKNCLIVRQPLRKESWATAIRRALATSSEDIVKMRKNIRSLRENYLLPAAFSSRLRHKLGFGTLLAEREPSLNPL